MLASKAVRPLIGFVLVGVTLSFLFCSCGVIIHGDYPERENGPRKNGDRYERLGVPRGHYPLPGSCRIWIPGLPPGQQSPPGDCRKLERRVPPGAWLLYHDPDNRDEIEVYVYSERRPSVVIVIRHYDIDTGRYLGETRP